MASTAAGQMPAPFAAPAGESVAVLQQRGQRALDEEDPVLAWHTFQQVIGCSPDRTESGVGLGRSHLMLGHAGIAIAYAEEALAAARRAAGAGGDTTGPIAAGQPAMALWVRAAIRARDFEGAVRLADTFAGACAQPTAELLAAQASALFRVQRVDDSARVYTRVVELDRDHGEAHLRLGSGLSAPYDVVVDAELRGIVDLMRRAEFVPAVARLQQVVQREPGNPVAHRLLGESLLQIKAKASMASCDPAYGRLAAAWQVPAPDPRRAREFMPAYADLDGGRRAVVDRALALFATRLPKLLAIGARHDLLLETDRTTDAQPRAMLRGTRTFDGRVWDDVRGIGGLQAATGIEALDDAAQFGFDTLAHEIAHQVHYYALVPRDRARIRSLYDAAIAAGRCLDYYAASNEAEYFGQGVEAFVSLGKRPGGEATHGHTRFELLALDPELHAFIAGIVDCDPLRGPQREGVLRAAIDVALRCGRADDAIAAAEMLPPGAERQALVAKARTAARAARSW